MVPEPVPKEERVSLQWRRISDLEFHSHARNNVVWPPCGTVAAGRNVACAESDEISNRGTRVYLSRRGDSFHRDLSHRQTDMDTNLDSLQCRLGLPFPGRILRTH